MCYEVRHYIPMHSQPHRFLKICLGLLVVASATASIVLPTIGAQNFFVEFQQPYSASVHSQLLGEQVVGPVYTLLLSSIFIMLLFLRKRLIWWLWLTVLLGPIYTVRAVGGRGHDFSHTVFQECSGIYGTWILGLSLLGSVSLILLAILTRFWGDSNHPRSRPGRGA